LQFVQSVLPRTVLYDISDNHSSKAVLNNQSEFDLGESIVLNAYTDGKIGDIRTNCNFWKTFNPDVKNDQSDPDNYENHLVTGLNEVVAGLMTQEKISYF